MARQALAALVLLLALGFAAAVKSGDPIPGQYIVTYSSDEAKTAYQSLAASLAPKGRSMSVTKTFAIGTHLAGEVVNMSARQAKRLQRVKGITVEQDRCIVLDDAYGTNLTEIRDLPRTRSMTQVDLTNSNLWGLDRVEQRTLPLDKKYSYLTAGQGQGVTVYVLDTGIRTSHTEFGGRATNVFTSRELTSEGPGDNDGHGSHCAGTIGGRNVGLARQVSIRGVKVLGRNGGSNSGVIDGINFAVADCAKLSSRRCVISMSLGGGFSSSLNSAVAAATRSGLVVVVAAGNDNVDACTISPASTPEAVTVGATDSADRRASFSNFGGCVDIMAPGVNIFSASHTSDTAGVIMSGTSMAAPHVAGAAALIWSQYPTWSSAQIVSQLQSIATTNRVSDIRGSPNRLLYTLSNTCPSSCSACQSCSNSTGFVCAPDNALTCVGGTCSAGQCLTQPSNSSFASAGLFWTMALNNNCTATCQAAGRTALTGGSVSSVMCAFIPSTSGLYYYPGTKSSSPNSCFGVYLERTSYIPYSRSGTDYLCGCTNGMAAWTAGRTGTCSGSTPNLQPFCRFTSNGKVYMGWQTTYLNAQACMVSDGTKAFYSTTFDRLCTSVRDARRQASSMRLPPPSVAGIGSAGLQIQKME